MKTEKLFVPKPELLDFGTISSLVPVIGSTLGLFLMSVEAMVFVQFKSLPSDIRFYVSIVSAFLMAFGGEVGTISNTVEIFRKYIQSKMSTKFEWEIITIWDWTGLIISALATLLAMFIASSTRPDSITSWAQFFSEWLLVPLMIVAVGDVYAGVMELGLRVGTFELRMRHWLDAAQEWRESQLAMQIVPKPEPVNLKCWCGAKVTSFEHYNQHLELHKQQSLEFETLKEAKEHFEQIAIADADFSIPSVADIAKWRV